MIGDVTSASGRRGRKESGFTLVELLVVIGIISILMGMLLPVLAKSRESARRAKCTSNIRQFALALELYKQQWRQYPAGSLQECLFDLAVDADVFHCPEDDTDNLDSYSAFYIERAEFDRDQYIMGCPRHMGGQIALNLFSWNQIVPCRLQRTRNDGKKIAPGDIVKSGTLSFSDGSTMKIKKKQEVQLIQSFLPPRGPVYSLSRLLSEGEVEVKVTPGSHFEVITGIADATVWGTEFKMKVEEDDSTWTVSLEVKEGKVEFREKGQSRGRMLGKGQSAKVKDKKPKTEKDNKGKGS